MGSGAETARETAAALRREGEKVGVLQVRLFRPFSAAHFLAALPETCRAIAVLEQTKEPGATGEPLYLDVVEALAQAVRAGQRGEHAAGSSAAATGCRRRISARPWPRRYSTN